MRNLEEQKVLAEEQLQAEQDKNFELINNQQKPRSLKRIIHSINKFKAAFFQFAKSDSFQKQLLGKPFRMFMIDFAWKDESEDSLLLQTTDFIHHVVEELMNQMKQSTEF